MESIQKDQFEVVNVKQKKSSKTLRVIRSNLLIIFIVISVAAGVGVGLALRKVWTHEEYRNIFYLEFPGRILLNMLKLLILPLIISSLITGLANIDTSISGQLGTATVLYYLTTTLSAVITGVILVMVVHPGSSDDKKKLTRIGIFSNAAVLDSVLDLISQCFPDNVIAACFQRIVTQIVTVNSSIKVNKSDNTTYVQLLAKPKLVAHDGMNVLGIVFFSIALGCVINYLGDEGRPLRVFFRSLNSATMTLITIVIWYMPIGLLFLVASDIISTDNLVGAITNLGMYMCVVIGGLSIHGFVVLPLLYFVCTRKNPVNFAGNMLTAFLTAWGTDSSSATLPVTMDCLINKNHINSKIVKFMVPIGATVNMDGTALYEAVACIFIAQVNGVSLGVADVIVLSLTATAAATGASGIPQAGLVTMVLVLTAVGLPTEDVTLILSIDWFLDRFRTVINVWGDCVGAGILNHFFGYIFPPDDLEQAINLDDLVDNIKDGYLSFLDIESSRAASVKGLAINPTIEQEEKTEGNER